MKNAAGPSLPFLKRRTGRVIIFSIYREARMASGPNWFQARVTNSARS